MDLYREVVPFGISIVLKASHDKNVYFPMDLTIPDNLIFLMDAQRLKARSPIEVTEAGISMDCRATQRLKAQSPILTIVLGRLNWHK